MATFDCSNCGLAFTSKAGRSNHIRSVHQATATLNIQLNGIQQSIGITRIDGQFPCPYCPYANEWAVNVGRHLKTCANYRGNFAINSYAMNNEFLIAEGAAINNQAANDHADIGDGEMDNQIAANNDRELQVGNIENGNVNAHAVTAELIGTNLYCTFKF